MKRALALITMITIGVFCAQILDIFPFSTKPERRFLLYSIHRDLRPNQSRAEVDLIIQRHQAPFLHRYDRDDAIILRTDTGVVNAVLLTVTFSDGALSTSRIRGEDGPHETFEDAPPDITAE